MQYFYKDHNRTIHFTRGKFQGWTEPTGLLNVPYARFKLKSEMLFIPMYDLTRETRKALVVSSEFDRHTADHPFCSDVDHPCHAYDNPETHATYLREIDEPFLAGLLTWGEMWRLFRGRQV